MAGGRRALALAALLGLLAAGTRAGKPLPVIIDTDIGEGAKPLPVIIDTDIGNDFDDSWAIALALADPMLDVRLIVTDTQDTVHKAQTVGRYLTAYGRTDVPIGIGHQQNDKVSKFPLWSRWGKYYNLTDYKGVVYSDGVAAMAAVAEEAYLEGNPVALISLASPVNLGEYLAVRFPHSIKFFKHVYAMFGSINYCYGGQPGICPEANADDPRASTPFLSAGWNISITPLDTCGLAHVRGKEFQDLVAKNTSAYTYVHPLLTTLCLAYGPADWCKRKSDTLFDPVAVYMIHNGHNLIWKDLRIKMTKDPSNGGYLTKPVKAPEGHPVRAALEWVGGWTEGLVHFQNYVVQTLTRANEMKAAAARAQAREAGV